jgi:hypothetical protein
MRNPDMLKKYHKAQKHFEKGNYIRAKWLFEYITMSSNVADSDSMGDINLHNYCEEYIELIEEKTRNKKFALFLDPIFFLLIGIVVFIGVVTYLIIRYAV